MSSISVEVLVILVMATRDCEIGLLLVGVHALVDLPKTMSRSSERRCCCGCCDRPALLLLLVVERAYGLRRVTTDGRQVPDEELVSFWVRGDGVTEVVELG